MKVYDMLIIGGGPAGLCAAIYAGRAKLNVLVIEFSRLGGNIMLAKEIGNYPGVPDGNGPDLTKVMVEQAKSFGAEMITDDIMSVDFSDDVKYLRGNFGEYYGLSVIVATGMRRNKAGFAGEADFSGRGVAYCGTCDGGFFAGKDIFVVGSGLAAAEEAIYLTRYGKTVTAIVGEENYTCPAELADKIKQNPKIKTHFNTDIIHVKGDDVLKEARFKNKETGEEWDYHVSDDDHTFGVFVFGGQQSVSQVFSGQIAIDPQGRIPTDEEMQTDKTGVYAAGDVRPKRLRQLVTAMSDGAIAATHAEKYISELKERLGDDIKPKERASEHHVAQDADGGTENLFDADMVEEIKQMLGGCETRVTVAAILKDGCEESAKKREFLEQFAKATDKVDVKFYKSGENTALEGQIPDGILPAIVLLDENGNSSGIYYHGVPGGHEFPSFILGIYNVAGPGQKISEGGKAQIKALKPQKLQVAISLSCEMCPEVVQHCQRIAAINPDITTQMLNLRLYPDIQKQHSIMSLPALIVDGEKVIFGKKSIGEIVEILGS
ncbi:MAG: FAD-dependent oxidoreductase [Defluviitaleaceae bacterium]|nr:FAD-dependent oxidoreductase [Defluviitaleaceae bacterium]